MGFVILHAVHSQHGVCRFRTIEQRVDYQNGVRTTHAYLVLEFADGTLREQAHLYIHRERERDREEREREREREKTERERQRQTDRCRRHAARAGMHLYI